MNELLGDAMPSRRRQKCDVTCQLKKPVGIHALSVYSYMGVSENNGTSKSSILIGFSIINHPFWGTTIFGNTHIIETSVW